MTETHIRQIADHTNAPQHRKGRRNNLICNTGHHVTTASCNLFHTNGQLDPMLLKTLELCGC